MILTVFFIFFFLSQMSVVFSLFPSSDLSFWFSVFHLPCTPLIFSVVFYLLSLQAKGHSFSVSACQTSWPSGWKSFGVLRSPCEAGSKNPSPLHTDTGSSQQALRAQTRLDWIQEPNYHQKIKER